MSSDYATQAEALLKEILPADDSFRSLLSFGVIDEEPFTEDPVPAVVPAPSSIPLPPGFPVFQLPTIPGLPSIQPQKLNLPGFKAPAIPNGVFSNLVPTAPSELFDKVKNDFGDLKPQQALSSLKSVASFPIEPQAISQDIAKIAPSITQDLINQVLSNSLALFTGVYVPGKQLFDLVLGISQKAQAIGSEALTNFGNALNTALEGYKNLENLYQGISNGLGNALNQASGLLSWRQVPIGPRNLISSDVPEHTFVGDTATYANWPNGDAVPDDPLAGLDNSVNMVTDAHNIAAGLASAEKASSSIATAANLLAQGVPEGSLALQLDGLLRLHSIYSMQASSAYESNPSILHEERKKHYRKQSVLGGQVSSATVSGTVSGAVEGTLAGKLTDGEVTGPIAGMGSGTFSGEVSATVGRATVSGGTTQPDGSITGATLTVQELSGVSVSGLSGSAEVKGTVTGTVSGGAFEGEATGAVSGSLEGNLAGTVAAVGKSANSVIRNTQVNGLVGSGTVAGTGAVASGTGAVVGSATGTLTNGALSGGTATGGTITGGTITNPVYGPDGSLQGGSVTGTVSGLAATGAVTGGFAGAISGTVQGLQATVDMVGKAKLEITQGTVQGGTNLGDAPTSKNELAARLAALSGKGTGAMPGNLLDLAYGKTPQDLPAGYLQSLPGRIADNLNSPNGRLLDQYMQDPAADLDSLTPLLPELLLGGNEALQQLILALRTLQQLIVYLNALPEASLELLKENATQVGGDFVFFVEVLRAENAQLGTTSKIAANYLKRYFTYNQRQLVRKFATLWDDLQTDPTTVADTTLKAIVSQVMGERKKVFGR